MKRLQSDLTMTRLDFCLQLGRSS
uniref:Uncharacterized protein n=1 Tax=Rhizophora mucronata TaxID=61149 RepID=A0A2P2PUZ5_RHIMU